MRTLSLKEAATFLKMTPEGLRRKIAKGEIPASKIGKCWIFLDADLVEHVRSGYATAAETSWGVVDRRTTWHSTKDKIRGGSISATMEKDYNAALALTTK